MGQSAFALFPAVSPNGDDLIPVHNNASHRHFAVLGGFLRLGKGTLHELFVTGHGVLPFRGSAVAF
jgi:hypothetical protein